MIIITSNRIIFLAGQNRSDSTLNRVHGKRYWTLMTKLLRLYIFMFYMNINMTVLWNIWDTECLWPIHFFLFGNTLELYTFCLVLCVLRVQNG